jgi:guanylate cyclase
MYADRYVTFFILTYNCLFTFMLTRTINKIIGAVISKKEEPLLVMEYMDHGSLYDLLHNETMTIEGEVVLPILRDIAQGVRFLHASSPQVIHGDLKAQNILVDSKFRAKVADFGLSQKKQVGGTGTPFWMAPELLRRESINTSASDVYSFGIILYELYSREEPYEGEDFQDVIRQVCDPKINKRPPRPPNMPAEVASFFMNNCLLANPEERPSFDDLDLVLKRFQVANVEPGKEVSSIQENKILAREAIAKRNASLLYEVFPKKVADALSAGRKVEPEHFSCVTIFFTDIVGFTTICHSMSVSKVSDMLDRLYLKFDDLSREHDVFKLETIGDAWMGVTNLSTEQLDHTKRIAEFAIAAISVAAETLIDSERPELGVVQIRAGFHSGPVLANVVGSRAPKYTLFGDTVNTSSRMESTSLPGHIQCSDRAAGLLREQAPDISLKYRGEIKVKGKGDMHTYWLLAKNQGTPAFDKEHDSFIPDIFIDEINRSR